MQINTDSYINNLLLFNEKINRGYYMAGTIKSDQRGGCACGGKFKQVQEFGYSVPKCIDCGNYPNKLVISRYLPSLNGSKGEWIKIRWNHTNERLTTVWDAVAVIKLIDKEVQEGSFDPRKYQSRAAASQLKFKFFYENKYSPKEENRYKRGDISLAMLKKKKGYAKHLAFFDNIDIRSITSGLIFEYYDSWTDKLRTRDLVLQELRTILNYASDIEAIKKVPKFPKMKPAKKRKVENFLTLQEQEKIIDHISNPVYKAMIKLLALYAMRPCEIRALKWSDINYREGYICITRHFTDGTTLKEGRKSNEEDHYLPIVEDFHDAMSEIPTSLIKDDFVFKGRNGSAVGDRVLARAWHSAREKTGLPYVQLYEGTKHSRLSQLRSSGMSPEKLIELSGHTNTKTLERYAQLNMQQKLESVRSMID
jgi:integrase